MVDYYSSHQEDFLNPQHNLKGIDISKYIKCPDIKIGPAGVLFYISNKSCKILIDHMEKIKYNIFHFDDFSKSYPYTIEDGAVTYILYFNRISFTNNMYMYADYSSNNVIAHHTNLYKYQ